MHRISFAKIRMPLVVSLCLLYFGFHLMNGERGVYAYFRETHTQQALEEELANVTAAREAMELKVSGLRNTSLDRDLLDQQARYMLGMMGENEKVILLEAH